MRYVWGWTALALLIACGDTEGTPIDGGADAGSAADGGTDAGPPPAYWPLAGTEADLPTDDLEPLGSLLEGVRVVGIGESIHTTGGQIRMRGRLIRHLVSEEGFRVIALENPRIQTQRDISPFIDDCTGTALEAATSINPIWWDRSTPELFQWLCDYNTSHADDPVRMIGVDLHEPWNTFREAEAFLTATAPSDAAALLDGMRTCLGVGFADRMAFFSDPTILSYYEASAPTPEGDHDACLAGVADTLAFMEENRATLVAAGGERDYELARLSVRGMGAFDEAIYHLSRRDLASANPPRDAAMADTLLTLLRLDHPDARTIIFAHNGHVLGRSSEVLRGQFMGVDNVGTLVQQELGDEYAAIGQLSLITHIDWTTGPVTRNYSEEGGLEPILDELGHDFLLVDTQAALAVSPPLWEPDTGYFVGSELLVPTVHYLALVFHHESPANDYFRTPPFAAE